MSEHTMDFLFLKQNELSFALHSIKTILDNSCLKTEKCELSIRSLNELKSRVRFVIVEAGQLLEQNEVRLCLLDLCIRNSSRLVLIGGESELSRLKELISPGIIAACFCRPVNAKEIAGQLQTLARQERSLERRKKVLIVDDSPTFLRTASDWLADDYNVSICPSATAAFHIIETNRPDLILLDYEMPVCSGAQFLEMLHCEPTTGNIPVIFLTSRNDPATVKEVLSLKPQRYLLKNQPKQAILKSIAEFFASHAADIVIENAEIWMASRNFSGRADINGNTVPGFCILLEPECAETMQADGWEIRYTKPVGTASSRPYLFVCCSYGNDNPDMDSKIWKVFSNGSKSPLNRETVACLDADSLGTTDISLYPVVVGNGLLKACVREMFVTVEGSELMQKYFSNSQPPIEALEDQ